MNSKFINTQIQKLAQRSQKIIIELGGVEQLLDFYYKNKSFLSIPKAGRFTNEELIIFCNYLISEIISGDKKEFEENEKEIEKNEKEIDIEEWVKIYEIRKHLLNKRLKNIINSLEIENKYKVNLEYTTEYFKKYFLNEFDFLSIENLGLKSNSELDTLRKKLLNTIQEIEEPQEKHFNKEIYQSKSNIFPIHLNFEERQVLFINGEYSFKKMLCIFLMFTNKIKERAYFVLKSKFFVEQNSDKKTFSKELNCSRERVRQIEIELRETTLPWAIDRVYQSFDSNPYDLPQPGEKNILILDNFPDFLFRGSFIEPNAYFSKIVYSQILFNSCELLDNFIKKDSKSFICPNIILFISKNFINETTFEELIEWLDDQIYNFETVGFEYRLEVLIKRFFTENKKYIDENSLRDMTFIISNIKSENIEISENILKRIHKNNRVESVLNEIYLFLKEKNEGQTTNVILDHLNEKNLEIEKEYLLRYLNKKKTTFSSFGMGYWTLVEWKNENDKIFGSFRDIVRNMLSSRTDPIHISELYEYINKMKKVSVASMMSNLRSETEGTFKFFNCSYIGLSDKHYSDYWYQLPKIKPVQINKNVFPINGTNEEEKINAVCSKYGYPIQHIKFILDCRRGKCI